MEKQKVFGAVAGSLMLASSGIAVAATAAQAQAADLGDGAAVIQQDNEATAAGLQKVSSFSGEFAFDQDTLTKTDSIAYAFGQAILGVCASLPTYDLSALDRSIAVGGDVAAPMEATVDEMAQSGELDSAVMMCACLANLAGGGVAANAKAAGVTVASLAEAVGA